MNPSSVSLRTLRDVCISLPERWRTGAALAPLCLALSVGTAGGATGGATLVQDITPPVAATANGGTNSVVRIGSTAYFGATDAYYGSELWKTDGTDAGTTMVRDIRPGSRGSSAQQMAVLDGVLYFVADDGVHGQELWKSDGTSSGTVLAVDILPGPDSVLPRTLGSANGRLWFRGTSPGSESQLWTSDGTPEGTRLLKEGVRIGTGAIGNLDWYVALDGYVYFPATDDAAGRELWRSDGTPAGTTRVADLRPGPGQSNPQYLTVLGSWLYFTANTPTNSGIFRTNGTLTEFVHQAYITRLAEMGGELYFAWDNGGGQGLELWKSNGAPGNATLVADVNPGSPDSNPEVLGSLNGVLYFTAEDPAAGRELWKTDGTSAGTVRVSDTNPGPDGRPVYLHAFGQNRIYLLAGDNAGGSELWASDGTGPGTVRIRSLYPNGFVPGALRPWLEVGGRMLFGAEDPVTGRELWTTDGTAAGTAILKDINRTPKPSGGPSNLAALDSALLFDADDVVHGAEPWIATGTPPGASLLTDIAPGAASGIDSRFRRVLFQGAHYFVSTNTSGLHEIWKTDGTPAGTLQVESNPGGTGRINSHLWAIGSHLFYATDNGEFQTDLWASDGTPGASVKLATIDTQEDLFLITDVNGTLFMQAFAGLGLEIWKSDGTPAGTVLVKDLGADFPLDFWFTAAALGDTLFFAGGDPSNSTGIELWKTDGTEAGTVMVKDIAPGAAGSGPTEMAAWNGRVYMAAHDGTSGFELWASDGTEAGTVRVKDIYPGAGGSQPAGFTEAFGALWFRAGDPDHGTELWKTDGTAAGTVLVKDINPGPASSAPEGMVQILDALYFSADDGVHGEEVWWSRGTEPSTILASEIRPGRGGSLPSGFTLFGPWIYFGATDSDAEGNGTGRELWAIPASGAVEGAPTVTGLTVLNPGTLELAFSEPMSGSALAASAYTLSGTGRGTLTAQPDTVVLHTPTSVRLTWNTGSLRYGQVTVTAAATLTDTTGETIIEPRSASAEHLMPGGTSIPGAPVVTGLSVADSRTLLVTFSEAMSSDAVAPGFYTLSGPGQGGLDASPASAEFAAPDLVRLSWASSSLNPGLVTVTVNGAARDATGEAMGAVRSASTTVPAGLDPGAASFTFQGRLNQNGAPASAPHDFRFHLYDSFTGGTRIGAVQTAVDVPVTGGLFVVHLDFGREAFDGGRRYLEIETRPAGSGEAWTLLTPRQIVTAAPYALTSGGSLGGPVQVGAGGTTLQRVQSGSESVGSGPGGVKVVRILFPIPFSEPPEVTLTVRNGQPSNDTFSASVREVTAEFCDVNVVRTDTPGAAWTQSPRVSWMAWE